MVEGMVNKGTKYHAILATPLAFAGIIFITAFIRLWVGNDFIPYAVWGIIYLSSYIFDPAMGIVSTTIFSLGHHKVITIVRTISTIINVILSIYLIKYFGIGGPILGTVITASLLNIPTYPYFCRLLKINWRKSFFSMYKIVFLNIPTFAILFVIFNYAIKINNWLSLLLYASLSLIIFYSPLFYYFIDPAEKVDINNILSKVFRRNIYLYKV
jgi:O-antigen/teichoic acid export membrane protein